jgi:hypothetical protein
VNPDYSKRGYLLPNGCKDLIDVIRLEEKSKPREPLLWPSSWPQPVLLMGDLFFSDATLVSDLAALLGQKPCKIIAELMQLGVFATVRQALNFEAVSKIAWKYGYTAKRLG